MKLLLGFIALFCLLALAHAADPQPWPGSQCLTYTFTAAQTWSTVYYLDKSMLGRHIHVRQIHDAISGFDPDVYVRWGNAPTRSEYDGHDFSRGLTSNIQIYPTEEQRTGDTSRLYIASYSYTGTGEITLCVDKFACKNRDCGHAEAAENTCNAADGTCSCNSSSWSGEFCEVQIVPSSFGHQQIKIKSRKKTALKYTATQPAGEIHIDVERPNTVYNDVVIRARRGAIPDETTFDFEKRIGGFSDSGNLVIDRHAYAPGDWYVTLETSAASASPFDVDISTSFYLCPGDCSGHGKCAADTAGVYKCTCEKDYQMREDCSAYAPLLVVNNTAKVELAPHAENELHFNITQNVESVNVEALFKYTSDNDCGSTCPRIYISKVTSSKSRASKENFIATSRYPPEKAQSISIPDHDLVTGVYTVTIANPAYTAQSGQVELHYVPHCPNACSGHGSCSWDGVCHCYANYHSSDCSVNEKVCKEKLPASAGLGGLGLFFAIAVALAVGGVGGIFIFKVLIKNHKSPSQRQQQIQSDDQYSQLT